MSQAEDEFEFQLKSVGITGWVREHQFDKDTIACGPCDGVGTVPGKRKARVKCRAPGCKNGRLTVGRGWALDFAWPEQKIAVEIEGGVYVKGRHTRGAAFEEDCVKYNTAACAGWTVVRVTPRHVTKGEALRWVENLLPKKT